jgi:hypothetical protein
MLHSVVHAARAGVVGAHLRLSQCCVSELSVYIVLLPCAPLPRAGACSSVPSRSPAHDADEMVQSAPAPPSICSAASSSNASKRAPACLRCSDTLCRLYLQSA